MPNNTPNKTLLAMLKSKKVGAFIIISLILLITFFTSSKQRPYSHLVDERFSMDTLMKIDVWSDNSNIKSSKKSLSKAFLAINEVRLSVW